MKILITGASGWLGRNSIKYFLNQGIPESNLILVASKNKEIQVDKNFKLKTIKFNQISNFINAEGLEGIVHLAYLTRDFFDKNLDKYIAVNTEISNNIMKLITTHNPNWVVYVSSGAIYKNYEKEVLEDDIVHNPYGFLKIQDEIAFREICEKRQINFTIGRLWGATGNDFIHAKKYAVGEFVINALVEKNILIKSNRKVYRTYCDSEQFMELCIRSASYNKFKLFDSKGEIIEIQNLASRIKKCLNSKIEIIRDEVNNTLVPDDYFARNNSMYQLANELDVKLLELDEQILKTATYIEKNLNHFT